MAPVKKKKKIDTKGRASNSEDQSSLLLTTNPAENKDALLVTKPRRETPNPARWSSGSWAGKANAVAEVARDSISAAATSASERLPPDSTSRRLAESLRTSSKSSATTHLSRDEPTEARLSRSAQEKKAGAEPEVEERKDDADHGPNESKPAEAPLTTDGAVESVLERPLPSGGWRGWWSRDGEKQEHPTESAATRAQDTPAVPESQAKSASIAEADDAPKASETNTESLTAKAAQQQRKDESSETQEDKSTDSQDTKAQQRTSWFGLWNSGQQSTMQPPPNQKGILSEPATSNVASDGFSALGDDLRPPLLKDDVKQTSKQSEGQTAGTWAFWSREPAKDGTSRHQKSRSESEAGELAIAKTQSESNPQPARMSEPEPSRSGASTPAASMKATTTDTSDAKPELKPKPKPTPSMAESILRTSVPTRAEDSSKSSSDLDDKSLKKALHKKLQKNLLLPAVSETLPYQETPTYIQSLWRMFGRNHPEPQKHLTLTRHPPKIKKAVAIGVHGYFPVPIIQKVLGPPTGTSLKFASQAASAITSHLTRSQPNCPFEIEKIALEGEGTIETRVRTLWTLLLNFMDHLRSADFILLACHSQGVPVAIMLLAKLLQFGVLKPDVRLGVCAMAGVNLGPFASYQSRFLGSGSANELFDFANSASGVSIDYAEALRICLTNGVRITIIGSIDDQLVSLESSLHVNVTHPYIYRSVFVDGRIHAPGFVTALIGLAAKLRNLGADDHGLIRELSAPLAGSLYGGEGHSRIYEDEAVYGAAIEFALGSVPSVAQKPVVAGRMSAKFVASIQEPDVKLYNPPSAANTNPYLLPWAMRGILGEELVQTRLKDEVEELRRLFDLWKPLTKQLKDVKVRLEGLKARL